MGLEDDEEESGTICSANIGTNKQVECKGNGHRCHFHWKDK